MVPSPVPCLPAEVVEVPAVREALRRLIGGNRPPPVVLRIGRGWTATATPRRADSDLLVAARPDQRDGV